MKIINLNQDKNSENNYISTTLLQNIEENLKKNKKIILYINKRGEFSSLICPKCSKIFKCKNCDVPLSIHGKIMICHICGHSENLKIICDNCKNNTLKKVGVGTEQIEKYLKLKFPQNKIFRFDTDVVKNIKDKKNALNEIKNAEIIIGTKMITTGFDFEDIGLVSVILLEQELILNKYNTEEKLYSNIKQLFGRGGRRGEKTDFLIQTFIPESEIIEKILKFNYKDYFLRTLEDRKIFSYPPFYDFVILEFRHKEKQKALDFIKNLKEKLDLKNRGGCVEIIFSEKSFRKYNQFYYKIILKGKNLRDFLKCIKTEIFKNKNLVVIFE